MSEDIAKSIESIANNMQDITASVRALTSHWWNNPLSSSLVTAIIVVFLTLLVGEIRDYAKNRKKIMRRWYFQFVRERNMDYLMMMAQSTHYGHSTNENGIVTITPEKNFAAKTLIEFRKKYKYWHLPYSKLRSLLKQCEEKIRLLPDQNVHNGFKTTAEYKNLQAIINQIIELAERKTGEDEWSIRTVPDDE